MNHTEEFSGSVVRDCWYARWLAEVTDDGVFCVGEV